MSAQPAPLAIRDDFERRLVNDFQRGFPIAPDPFHVLGEALGASEQAVIATIRRLLRDGAITRIGPVIRPGAIGTSTLACLAAPPDTLDAVAAIVNAHPEVNHNYERENRLNLWFVLTARTRDDIARALQSIEARTGFPVVELPLERPYHIDLGFDLAAQSRRPVEEAATCDAPVAVDADDERLLAAIEQGIPVVERPFAAIAARTGETEAGVIDRIERLLHAGVFRRFGIVVRHRRVGYAANAMCAWEVPAAQADAFGERLARAHGVTLAYRRRTSPPVWPYNLFGMVHGQDREGVEQRLADIAGATGLDAFPSVLLFSRRCYRQRGARYFGALRDAA